MQRRLSYEKYVENIKENIKAPAKQLTLKRNDGRTVCNPTKNEPPTGIIIEGHFWWAVLEDKTVLYSVRKYSLQNPNRYKKHSIDQLCKSIDWFLRDTSLYQQVFSNRL